MPTFGRPQCAHDPITQKPIVQYGTTVDGHFRTTCHTVTQGPGFHERQKVSNTPSFKPGPVFLSMWFFRLSKRHTHGRFASKIFEPTSCTSRVDQKIRLLHLHEPGSRFASRIDMMPGTRTYEAPYQTSRSPHSPVSRTRPSPPRQTLPPISDVSRSNGRSWWNDVRLITLESS